MGSSLKWIESSWLEEAPQPPAEALGGLEICPKMSYFGFNKSSKSDASGSSF